ncbi:hypothetical protein ElyMa_001527200 [Elysia marginata]|uniref:Uncharacterized protein n=1 Tax=Elysia marginata TaxID=1093978 RepID=A0AAV4J9W2_9GAST|nr:hypothetical protein ElyMa_001527200 [Elysia marginata]
MEDSNTNATPEDTTGNPGGATSQQATLATTSVARNAATGSAPGRGGSMPSSSRTSSSFVTYFLLLVRDLLTFFVRGGISAMMFAMDQTLRLVLLGADFLLGPTGASLLGYPCRLAMWMYQVVLWIVYTILELVLYLPWPMLLVYVAVLTILLMMMPPPLANIFKLLFKTLHLFIGVYKVFYGFIRG